MVQKTVWHVLSIDAVSSVNQMTRRALENGEFLGKNITVLNANSIQQAKCVLTDNDDIAVVLLDTMNDGLEESLSFIRFIRDTLKNYRTRIILRTGYPDTLPEISLIENYEIDGYLSKEAMPAMQIKIAVMTAIRAYHQIITTAEVLRSLAGSIAHETRNPLAQVKYTLDAIKNIIPGSFDRTTSLSISHEQSRELLQLIQQGLTSIKRGERVIVEAMNEVSNKPVDPKTFSYLSAAKTSQKAIDESVEPINAKDKISLVIAKDFTFKAEETLYIFILLNLIKNAVYYLKDHPQSFITITVDGNTNTIKVRDTGPGIPSHMLPYLFNSFFTSGKEGGTGLGLAYCKRTMQAFGGDITCDSVVNEFTEFTLSFPEVATQEPAKALEHVVKKVPVEDSRDVLMGKTVIIADDDEVSRQYIMSSLQLKNPTITVLEAQNGEGVLALLQQHKVDAVLIDMIMRPGMGGIEATKAIRAGQTQSRVPIIALTANVGDAYIEETKAAGMNDFLSKPVEDNLLLEKLSQYIKH